MKLDSGTRNILRLARKQANEEGWARVSRIVWPLVKDIPDCLLEKEQIDNGGRVRLTRDGEVVLNFS